MNNYYQALLEGRYQVAIELTESPSGYVASFTDTHGHTFEVEDASRAEAHRRCTDQVIEAIRNGDVVPEL